MDSSPDETLEHVDVPGDGNYDGNDDNYDLILGADITYDCSFPMISALLDLISSLSHDETWTLLAHGLRGSEQAQNLWRQLRQRWPEVQRLQRDGDGVSEGFEVMEDMEGETETKVVIFAWKGNWLIDVDDVDGDWKIFDFFPYQCFQ